MQATRTTLVGLILAVATTTAHAGLMNVQIDSIVTDWRASVQFDDATGQAWSLDNAMTVYAVTSMTVRNGPLTWDQSEIFAAWMPPDGGVVVDSTGRAALWVIARDTASGTGLSTTVGGIGSGVIGETRFVAGAAFFGGLYSASVGTPAATPLPMAEPAGETLLGLGLIALAVFLRTHNRSRHASAANA